MDKEILEHTVKQTNLYAEQSTRSQQQCGKKNSILVQNLGNQSHLLN